MLFWKKPREVTLIVGLGNPGEEYAGNRHNIGFMCIADLARQHGIKLNKKESQARTGAGKIAERDVVLARPQTFVNRSGAAIGPLVRRYRVTPDRLIIIHDDMDLPPGKIRIRRGGRTAGHKGVSSTIDAVGKQDFFRIRVGIGRPEATEGGEDEVIAHVLGDLTPEERAAFDEAIPRAGEAIECLLTEGLEAAMNRFN